MLDQFFNIDPQGDVLLVLRRPNLQHLVWGEAGSDSQKAGNNADPTKEEEVRFRLSSRHLSLASPVFNAMLSGGWKESTIVPQQPGTTANEKADKNDTHLRYEITATEWDVKAFTLLMNIIHGRHRQVPHSVDIETLARFSTLVDYYKCHETAEFAAHVWIKKLVLPGTHGKESTIWLLVSWVFSLAFEFRQMTELAIKEGQGPLETMCLPLPATLLTAIEQKRTESLHKARQVLGECYDGLLRGDKGCHFFCSSMLLGILMKNMDEKKIKWDRDLQSFSQNSLRQVRLMVLEMNTPRAYVTTEYPSPHQHSCDLRRMLQPGIDGIWTSLTGLWLGDCKTIRKEELRVQV